MPDSPTRSIVSKRLAIILLSFIALTAVVSLIIENETMTRVTMIIFILEHLIVLKRQL